MSTPRTARILLAAVASGLAVLSGGWLAGAGAAPAAVEVVDFGFRPDRVTVAVGEPVTWRWTGQANHSVTAPGRFDSHPDCTALTPDACGTAGATFRWTPEEPGEVGYRCKLHPDEMQGTVVVTAAASPEPSPSPTTAGPSPDDQPSPDRSPTADPTTAPTPSPTAARPSPTPSPAASPSPSASPIGSVSPDASPSPAAGDPSPAGTPSLEPFPEPVEPTVTPDATRSEDVVAVGGAGGTEGTGWRVVATLAVLGTAGVFTRVVLLGPDWS